MSDDLEPPAASERNGAEAPTPPPNPALRTDPEGNSSSTKATPANGGLQVEVEPDPNDVGFDLRFYDVAGKAIVGLRHKVVLVEDGKRLEFPGTSDGEGKGIRMSGMAVGTPLEVWVQKADGSYTKKYAGDVGCNNLSLCAVSPHKVIKVKPEPHQGPAGPQASAASAPKNAEAEKKPNAPTAASTATPQADLKAATGRNAQGNPVVTASQPTQDAAGRNRLPTLALWGWTGFGAKTEASKPQTSQDSARGAIANPAKVAELIGLMEEQTTWRWNALKTTYGSTAAMQTAIVNKDFTPDATKPVEVFTGNCYASVKLGLWRAHMVEGIGGGIYPATEAKAWLLSQGFAPVSNTEGVPDARWAAPGDVIVYQYDEETLEINDTANSKAIEQYEKDKKEFPAKQKAYEETLKAWQERNQASLTSKAPKKAKKDPKPTQPKEPIRPQGANYGHIDVRSYDGYLSDAKTGKLPSATRRGPVKGMVVNGIFRKYYDPLAQMRIRAFLKVLREWECHEESDDLPRYFLMLSPINGSRRFTDTSKHPHEGISTTNTAAGAYQFTLETYQRLSGPQFGIGPGFAPSSQDRFAVAYLEILPGTPLASIRKGDISAAAKSLAGIWSSLPDGKFPRKEKRNGSIYHYTMNDLIERHNAFMKEI